MKTLILNVNEPFSIKYHYLQKEEENTWRIHRNKCTVIPYIYIFRNHFSDGTRLLNHMCLQPFSFVVQEMSYNNYLDADAAWNCVSEFKNPTCVVVKHTNPCGVASRDDILEAYRLAVKADPVSAFGGIVAFNVEIDEVSFSL